MRSIRKNTYPFTGEQLGVINTSLHFKGEHGTFLRGESGGEGKNRYQRLLHKIDSQLPEEELEDSAVYDIRLGMFAKRTLRSALSFVRNDRQTIIDKEMLHEAKVALKHNGRMPTQIEHQNMREHETRRLAAFAVEASHILEQLGYLHQPYHPVTEGA